MKVKKAVGADPLECFKSADEVFANVPLSTEAWVKKYVPRMVLPPIVILVIWLPGWWNSYRGPAVALEADSIPTEAATHLSTGDYYLVIVQAVSELPDNTVEGRQAIYDRARTTFTALTDGQDPTWIECERRTLEKAIRQVDSMSAIKQRSRQRFGRASTILLVASMYFPHIWAIDLTSMSLYWRARLPKG